MNFTKTNMEMHLRWNFEWFFTQKKILFIVLKKNKILQYFF